MSTARRIRVRSTKAMQEPSPGAGLADTGTGRKRERTDVFPPPHCSLYDHLESRYKRGRTLEGILKNYKSVPSVMRGLLEIDRDAFIARYGCTLDRLAKLSDSLLENAESFFRNCSFRDIVTYSTAQMLCALFTLQSGECSTPVETFGLSQTDAQAAVINFCKEVPATFVTQALHQLYFDCSSGRKKLFRRLIEVRFRVPYIAGCLLSRSWDVMHRGKSYTIQVEAVVAPTKSILLPFVRIIEAGGSAPVIGGHYNVMRLARFISQFSFVVSEKYPCNSVFIKPLKTPRSKSEKGFAAVHEAIMEEGEKVFSAFFNRSSPLLSAPCEWLELESIPGVIHTLVLIHNMGVEDQAEGLDVFPVPNTTLNASDSFSFSQEELAKLTDVRKHSSIRKQIEQSILV